VKTGADLSQVVAWNYANSREILASGAPIPAVLHKRLSLDRTADERPPRPRFSTNHWLDETVAGIEGHIERMTAVRDEMAAAAKPPLALLEAAFAEPETITIGAGLNKTFAAALREPLPPMPVAPGEKLSQAEKTAVRQAQQQARYERARRAVWDSLHQYHPERHNAILRGAMVSALLSGGSDAAVWQAGEKTEEGVRVPGIGHKSVAALREIGLLESIRESEHGLLREGGIGVTEPVEVDTDYAILHIQEAWFHHHRQQAKQPPTNMGEMNRQTRQAARQALAEHAPAEYRNMRLYIKEESGRKVAYTAAGERVGQVSLQTAVHVQDGQTLTLRYALGRGGDLQAVVTGERAEEWDTDERG